MFASSVLRELVRRPRLWLEAVRAYVAMTPRTWWRRAPFLPLPRRAYLQWRLYTAYGSTDVAPRPEDVIEYLDWRRRQR